MTPAETATHGSTLDGYVPVVGDTVWQQMYAPSQPTWDAPIEARVAGGATYGPRRLMVVAVVDDHDPTAYARSLGQDLPVRHVTRWLLQAHDPTQRRGEFPYSAVDSDWCVLGPVDPHDDGRLL